MMKIGRLFNDLPSIKDYRVTKIEINPESLNLKIISSTLFMKKSTQQRKKFLDSLRKQKHILRCIIM